MSARKVLQCEWKIRHLAQQALSREQALVLVPEWRLLVLPSQVLPKVVEPAAALGHPERAVAAFGLVQVLDSTLRSVLVCCQLRGRWRAWPRGC